MSDDAMPVPPQGQPRRRIGLVLGSGMGGLDASRRIAELHPEAAMIAVSGDSGSEVIQRFAEYNFVSALAKPFSIDAVEDIVSRFL